MTAKGTLSRTRLAAFLVCVGLSVPVLSVENLVEEWVKQETGQDRRYHHPDISPDDRFTAFSVSSESWNGNTIWIHETTTGQLTQLTSADTSASTGDVLVRWAPQGDLLGFASDRGGESHIYTISAAGGTPRRITTGPLPNGGAWGCRFSFSPDGQRVVYSDGDDQETNLYSVHLGDGRIEQLTHFVGRGIRNPDWSPDGTEIIYESGNEFFIWDVTHGVERPLENSPRGSYPSWSPDGRWIGYQSWSNGFQTYLVPRTGGKAIKVGPGGDYVSQVPSWSSAGNHLVYHAGKRSRGPLTIHELSDRAEQVLMDPLFPGGWYWGSWSPDSHLLTFMSVDYREDLAKTHLFLGDVSTGTVIQIAQIYPQDGALLRHAPAWFGDSERFLMIQGKPDDTQIAQVSVSDPTPRPLTSSATTKCEVALSPDEELVAFLVKSGDGMDVWLFDLVTEEEIQLTFTERDKGSLAFSMDGEQIAFLQSNPNTGWDVMTISLDGGQPKQRTTGRRWELDPAWLDNGQISYTLHPEESRRSIAVGSLEDESSRRIISSKNGSAHLALPAWSPDQSQLYYQSGWPDGPFITRHMQSGMVEELIAKVWMPLLSRDGRRVAYINPPEPHPQYLWRENVEHIVRPKQLP